MSCPFPGVISSSRSFRVVRRRNAQYDSSMKKHFFRVDEWTEEEMYEVCLEIAERSVLYYFSKHSKKHFILSSSEPALSPPR